MKVELEKKIVKRGNKWLVTNQAGTEILGTHDNRADAVRQLAAIEASKQRRRRKGSDMNEEIRLMKIEEEIRETANKLIDEGVWR